MSLWITAKPSMWEVGTLGTSWGATTLPEETLWKALSTDTLSMVRLTRILDVTLDKASSTDVYSETSDGTAVLAWPVSCL